LHTIKTNFINFNNGLIMKTKIILMTIFSCFFLTTYSQIECGTPTNSLNKDYSGIIEGRGVYQPNEGPYCINVYFHIVRQTNGTGGFNSNQIDEVVDILNDAFNPHNIFINNLGQGFIDNNDYFNFNAPISNNQVVSPIFNINTPNAINVYLTNSIFVGGFSAAGVAQSIESRNFIVRNDRALTSTTPHELGHCLNLYHTHETFFGVENISGSNCTVAGDLICDTPADPRLGNQNVNSSCQYIGGNGYSPDTQNIMSYSRSICRTSMSYGQGQRMRDALQESNILQDVIGSQCSIATTIGDDVVCSNVGTVFTIIDAEPPYQWSVSPNMTITQNSGNSITVVSNDYYFSGYGFVEVTHSGGTIFKEVWLGKPDLPANIYGPELVNSGAIVNYQGGVAPGATSYQWWLPYPFDIVSPIDYFNDNWQMWPNNTRINSHVFTGYGEHSGYVQVMGVNKCGVGGAQFIQVSHDNNGGGSGPLPIVSPYPNAADDKFTLDFSQYPEGLYTIYIYDMYSNLKYYGETQNAEKTINTVDLPNGIYFLHFYNGTEIIQMQLLIQH